jgi:cytochrome c551/c552
MKKVILISAFATILYACGGGTEKKEETAGQENAASDLMKEDKALSDARGVGKFTDVKLDPKLDQKMATEGNGIYDLKCSSCHKLTGEKLVGPGWSGVTTRRKPEWIMNFATNTDEMLNKDAEAQALLEVCMVRMPNQNLSDDDARKVLEFMRKNDGVK